MKIKLVLKRYGDEQPAQGRSVLLLPPGTRNKANPFEGSTAFLTEHPTAGWLWHFHDARLYPRQPEADDSWAYYPDETTDAPKGE